MKDIITTGLGVAAIILLLGAVGPALDAKPEPQQRSFTQQAGDKCGNTDWVLNEKGDVVCKLRKALKAGSVKL